ncbi:MAG: hypothetical protein C0625_01135 [Arcobacter sp.]|nr:MAG: hypothetical protein C0625_01135 [Arcobacter sp.]
MSMSQEEIESLMNGLDIDDGDDSSDEPIVEENFPEGNMSEDDINALIEQTEETSTNVETASSEESVDDLLNSLEELSSEKSSDDETNIDDILKELEQNNNEEELEHNNIEEIEAPQDIVDSSSNTIDNKVENISNDNIDDILATMDGLDEEPVENIVPTSIASKNTDMSDIDSKINSGLFPLPVEEDTKVVNQLSEVASDSEEKATKIFDVLSNILDYNNDIQNDVQALNIFNEKQISMLTSLSQKFPNIDVFQENLNQAQQMGNHISDVNEKLNEGNTEIFQAMELMQYHDINRQKIERVMSVIRKLSSYLNNLFEDESNRPEVAVANHIHGDSTEDLVGDDDLEALIAEFNK